MLKPAGFSDSSSDDENFDQYPRTGGSIFGNNSVNVMKEEQAVGDHISEKTKGWEETKAETDLAIAKADLTEAVEAGDLEGVRSLLETVEVNTLLDVWGWGRVTASGLACCHGQSLVLELLVSTLITDASNWPFAINAPPSLVYNLYSSLISRYSLSLYSTH